MPEDPSDTVRCLYKNCISKFVDIHINNFYKELQECDFKKDWMEYTIKLAMGIIPETLRNYPIYLVIDDTIVGKFGTHFDDYSKLHDHCRRNGTDYIFGHCYVTLVMLVPVYDLKEPGQVEYIRVPIDHRLWIPKDDRKTEEDERTKLEMAKKMIEELLEIVKKFGLDNVVIPSNNLNADIDPEKADTIIHGTPQEASEAALTSFNGLNANSSDSTDETGSDAGNDRKLVFIVLCDSWYTKAPITDLLKRTDFKFILVGAARIDTHINLLPKGEHHGRGRKPIYGEQVKAKTANFEGQWQEIPGEKYKVVCLRGYCSIFGKREVSVFITEHKKEGERKVFVCSDPDYFEQFSPETLPIDDKAKAFLSDHREILPLFVYKRRWFIEICYMEQKKYWGLQNYMVRRENSFTSVVNLNNALYALTSMLPYLDPAFQFLGKFSIQERRGILGEAIHNGLIFGKFVRGCEHLENYDMIHDLAVEFCKATSTVA